MALLNRGEPNNIIPPPGMMSEPQPSNKARWPILLIYGLGALVVAILLVFGGRWIYRSVTDNSPAPAPQTQISQNRSNQSTQQPQKSTTPSPSPSSTGTNSQGKTPSPTPNPPSLPSNGPGDVAALFIIVSLAAAWLHYRFIAPRQSN
jgi:hypothetical protein